MPKNVAVGDRPRPRSCGKTNHIQWLRLRPAFSSSIAVSKIGACAVTKRSRSKEAGSVMP